MLVTSKVRVHKEGQDVVLAFLLPLEADSEVDRSVQVPEHQLHCRHMTRSWVVRVPRENADSISQVRPGPSKQENDRAESGL
eukprot:2822585-Rhodomonas_salina.1